MYDCDNFVTLDRVASVELLTMVNLSSNVVSARGRPSPRRAVMCCADRVRMHKCQVVFLGVSSHHVLHSHASDQPFLVRGNDVTRNVELHASSP